MFSDEQERLVKFLDHVTFPKAIGEFFRDDPQFEGVAYSAYHPKEPATVPCVLYKLQRRTPGVDGVETRKPRFRYKVVEEDGSITEVYAQWMSCVYQFDICAHSTDEVDDISRNFYAFLRSIVGELQKLGVGDVIFDEELEDQLVPRTSDMPVRSQRWFVKLESLELRNLPAIQWIKLRVLYPQNEGVEEVVRGDDIETPDVLEQTFITKILVVSDASPSGIARDENYIEGVDFDVWYDPQTSKTVIQWLDPGIRPTPGSTYYVRYLHWTAFSTLVIPTPPQTLPHKTPSSILLKGQPW